MNKYMAKARRAFSPVSRQAVGVSGSQGWIGVAAIDRLNGGSVQLPVFSLLRIAYVVA